MGCWKIQNYEHQLQVSCNGIWVEGGEFFPSLGTSWAILKAKHGLPLDRNHYCYLDAIHMDIAFGDCLLIGWFHYALIQVDCATRFDWMFDLKTLSYHP